MDNRGNPHMEEYARLCEKMSDIEKGLEDSDLTREKRQQLLDQLREIKRVSLPRLSPHFQSPY